MKRLLLTIALTLAVALTAAAQSNNRDVVYLKDGSVIKGTIIENVEGAGLKIKTDGGNVLAFDISEIQRVGKERTSYSYTRYPDGYSQRYSYNSYSGFYPGYQYRSPGLAWLCSALVPGLGQAAVNGEWGKGIGMCLGTYGLWGLAAICADGPVVCYDDDCGVSGGYYTDNRPGLATLCAIAGTAIYIWSMIDAPVTSIRLNSMNMWNGCCLNVTPEIQMNSMPGSAQSALSASTPTAGLKLGLTF
jgi:hypothetical protein